MSTAATGANVLAGGAVGERRSSSRLEHFSPSTFAGADRWTSGAVRVSAYAFVVVTDRHPPFWLNP
jgi:hypothetical protein